MRTFERRLEALETGHTDAAPAARVLDREPDVTAWLLAGEGLPIERRAVFGAIVEAVDGRSHSIIREERI